MDVIDPTLRLGEMRLGVAASSNEFQSALSGPENGTKRWPLSPDIRSVLLSFLAHS
jgi:hypothetical protein